MIKGRVNSDLEAVVRLRLYRPDESPIDVDAAIDTGFNGFVALSAELIRELRLVRPSFAAATLGEGSTVRLPVFTATAEWDGDRQPVGVLRGQGGPLVGMALLRGIEPRIEVADGGMALIRRMDGTG